MACWLLGARHACAARHVDRDRRVIEALCWECWCRRTAGAGWPPPAKPPVAQVSDCQAVMVPSFLPATLILPKAQGRLPAISCSVARSRKSLTGLPPAFCERRRADFGPGSGAELAAEAAADVVHLDLDIGGGDLEVGRQGAGPSGDELGGGPRHYLIALPLNHAGRGVRGSSG